MLNFYTRMINNMKLKVYRYRSTSFAAPIRLCIMVCKNFVLAHKEKYGKKLNYNHFIVHIISDYLLLVLYGRSAVACYRYRYCHFCYRYCYHRYHFTSRQNILLSQPLLASPQSLHEVPMSFHTQVSIFVTMKQGH